MVMSELLKIENLKKVFTMHQFEGKQIVGCSGINITLHKGEFIGITGKSGAGKSTILKSIYRTYIPTGGHIYYHSDQYGFLDLAQASERQVVQIRKNEIGYVSQFLNVMPRVTALELVSQALVEMGTEVDSAEEEAKRMLKHFQLSERLWDAYPNTFSGGEKLRLNLARAMVKRPKLLLLDEPTASLDNSSKQSVKEMIFDLKQAGTSMLGIFHDLDFMDTVVDRQFNMQHGLLQGGHVL